MNTILIYHQNICSVINKIDELYMHMQIDGIAPHLICLTEHHLKQPEINNFSLKGYKLASEFCRKKLGRVSMYSYKQSVILLYY